MTLYMYTMLKCLGKLFLIFHCVKWFSQILDGQPVPTTNIINMYCIFVEERKIQLYDLILLEVVLPNINQEHIYNNLSCLDQSYVFLFNRRH